MTTKKITFWELLQSTRIEIPVIQRDYAQGREGKEYLRKNFLACIKQALDGEPLKLDFVYGSVENNKLQPLDGQQRLTTLWLLHWYIALFAHKYEEAFSVLLRFSYETRISSREFMQNLCNPENFKNFDFGDVTKFIQDATWFYSAWHQDPTISSMLRMIKGTDIGDKNGEDIVDGFDELFEGARKEDFESYWRRLTETDAIVFYQQPLENFGLSDDLYVKMNARGKQLTPFENFKADLIDYLQEQERESENSKDLNSEWKDVLDPLEGIPIRLDSEWTNLFWENSSACRIDEIFYAFINRFFWNELFVAKDDRGDYVLRLSSESKNMSYEYFNADAFDKYVGFEPYKFYKGSIPVALFKKLKVILDNYCLFQGVLPEPSWMKGFNFIPVYKSKESGKEEKTEISGINQLQRIVFFAICKYFSEGVADQQSLNRWMRVAYNLISGVDHTGGDEIRDVSGVRNAITYIAKLDSRNVIQSLATQETGTGEETKSSALTLRWNEEIAKARQIMGNSDWESKIIKAEEYSFFRGSIRFLFQNATGAPDWERFDEKWASVQKFFAPDEGQGSIMNEGYDNTELLKTLFSRFTADNFNKRLWWHYRTFNNSADSWRYYLLSSDLCGPIHYLLLECSPCAQWEKPNKEKDVENVLYLLTQTGLLDYVSTKMESSWIRQYNGHVAIYPSAQGIYLNAYFRDSFLLDTCGVEVDDAVKIPDAPLLFGWDVNFRYRQCNFQWYRTDYIYLMESDDCNSYVKNQVDGQTDEERYFCFKADVNGMSKEDIIKKLDKLIQKYER